MKKNISLEQIFNIAFLTGFVSLFFARLFYVVSDFSVAFLNPLVFFIIPYFPGLLLSGGIAGGIVFLYLFLRYKKLPIARIFDFFSLAAFAAISVALLIQIGVGYYFDNTFNSFNTILSVFFFGLFLFFITVLYPRLRENDIIEGTISLLFLFSFSVFTFLMNMNLVSGNLPSLFTVDTVLLILLFIFSFFLLTKREQLLPKFRRVRR